MGTLRRQLSMYVPGGAAGAIEQIRRMVDPVQAGLIPAHVTLCRDDELDDLAHIGERLAGMAFAPIALRFGRPTAFSTHGIVLPCIDGGEAFRALRVHLLGARDIRDQQPHITLAHPRNRPGPANSLDLALQLAENITLVFPTIFLIEQIGSAPWRVRERHTLAPA